MRLLYYARGGGHGHVLRGLALLRRLGHGTLLGPARLAHWAAALDVDYVAAPDACDATWIGKLPAPGMLLVDVFPRGVVGELAPLLGRTSAWLISRWVSPDYYCHPPVRAAITSAYERLVWTEPPPAALRSLPIPQLEIEPVLLGSAALGREEARRALGLATGERLLLGIGSGDVDHQMRLCRLLGKVADRVGVELRFVSAELPPSPPVVRLFPAARVLAAADVVVTAGGYHAFHETRRIGAPTVFIPQRRRYDDQWQRVLGRVVATDPVELECCVRRLLTEQVQAAAVAPRAVADGATALARLVERRVQQGVLAEEEIAALA